MPRYGVAMGRMATGPMRAGADDAGRPPSPPSSSPPGEGDGAPLFPRLLGLLLTLTFIILLGAIVAGAFGHARTGLIVVPVALALQTALDLSRRRLSRKQAAWRTGLVCLGVLGALLFW
jgi:hypothetical protein